jgi:hypothetical protein
MGPIRPSNQTIQQISPARQLDQNHLFIGLLDNGIKIIYSSSCSTACREDPLGLPSAEWVQYNVTIRMGNYLYKTMRANVHAADGRPSGSSLQAGEKDWIGPFYWAHPADGRPSGSSLQAIEQEEKF